MKYYRHTTLYACIFQQGMSWSLHICNKYIITNSNTKKSTRSISNTKHLTNSCSYPLLSSFENLNKYNAAIHCIHLKYNHVMHDTFIIFRHSIRTNSLINQHWWHSFLSGTLVTYYTCHMSWYTTLEISEISHVIYTQLLQDITDIAIE